MKKKQYLILGAGRFGLSLAKTLVEMDQEVMLVDRDMERIQKASADIEYAVQGDIGNEDFLMEIGARNFDVVVISVGTDIETSVLVSLLLKEIGVKFLVSKAMSSLHAKALYRIGVDRVVFPEQEMGIRMAHNLVNDSVVDMLDFSLDYRVVEVKVPESWVGKTIGELDVRKNHNITVIARKNRDEIFMNIGAGSVFEPDDTILLLGHKEDVRKLVGE